MKIRSILWIISKPSLWLQGIEIMKRRLFLNNDNYKREEALEWCKSNAVSEHEAIEKLTKIPEPVDLENLFYDEYQYALAAMDSCPVQMGGPGALNLLYQVTAVYKPFKIIETGVAYGWSTLALLLGCRSYKSKLISIDMPYIGMNNEAYVGVCVPEPLRANWQLIRKADRQGLPNALDIFDHSIDLCHYDSDKSYSGRMWAYPKLWDALKPGGIFISDDIQDNIAFKEFCSRLGRIPIIVISQRKYVGILVK